MKDTQELLAWIARCPTPFHTVAAVCAELEAKGYHPLSESRRFDIKPGENYYVTRNGSSVIALRVPESGWGSMHLTASHTDSPCLKVKDNGVITADGYRRLNVEVYGGTILSSWLDRPLSVAGRLVVRTPRGLESRLADVARDLLVIPSVDIHQNNTVNNGYKYNPQVDLQPLFADAKQDVSLQQLLAESAGVGPEQIVAGDMFVYSRQPGFLFGAGSEYFAAPRIDDLGCVFTTLKGFTQAAPAGLSVWCALDNEEVGSTTKQGACSPFLADTLRRVCRALGQDEEAFAAALPGSFLISADNAHAKHPNHPELADASNPVQLGAGIVLKSHAGQKYTTDAVSAAVVRTVCERAGVPVQTFANRSDMPSGSTLGNLSNTQLALNAADVGLPQLAMHSACESAAAADVEYMVRAIRAFYELPLKSPEDGIFEL